MKNIAIAAVALFFAGCQSQQEKDLQETAERLKKIQLEIMELELQKTIKDKEEILNELKIENRIKDNELKLEALKKVKQRTRMFTE
jgi:hypothetical protein